MYAVYMFSRGHTHPYLDNDPAAPWTVIATRPSQFDDRGELAKAACSCISACALSYFLRHGDLLRRSNRRDLSKALEKCIVDGIRIYTRLRRDQRTNDSIFDDNGYAECGMTSSKITI